MSDQRILIVDDTLKNIQVVGAILRKEGYKLHVARNGVQALELAQKVTPDLVLLDVMMPEMDGFETCERLKADPDTRDIPVIFLSADSEVTSVVTGFQVGAVDYVAKPFNAAELLQRVSTHLLIRELRVSLQSRVQELAEMTDAISTMTKEYELLLQHELNNLISPILGYAELLSRSIDQNQVKQRKWAESIEKGAINMRSLLLKLREMQEIERGGRELETARISFSDLLAKEVQGISRQFPGIGITFEKPNDPHVIQGDETLLSGVILNLIKNAAEHVQEHVPQGGSVSVRLMQEGEYVHLQINNGGPAIPSERLKSFFEKFNSTKGKHGTGLGTSYCRAVVQAHGGEIGVESDEVNGTTVSIMLPAA